MDIERVSILIVDDEKRLRDLLHSILLEEGYEVQEASGGTEAVRMLLEK